MGFGPVAALARLLRSVHEQAGEPPLDQMKFGPSSSTASRAKSGQFMPTRECVVALLQGCGVATDGDIYHSVLRTWAETDLAGRAFRPDLTGCETDDDLVERFVALAEGRGLATRGRLHAAELARRLAETAGTALGETKSDRKTWTVEAVPEAEIVAEFVDRDRPPTGRVLDNLVFACGGIDRDVRHWRKQLDRVAELRRKRQVLASIGPTRPAITAAAPEARADPSASQALRAVAAWAVAARAVAARIGRTRRGLLVGAVAVAVTAAVVAAGVLIASHVRRSPPAVLPGPSSPPVESVGQVPPYGSVSAQAWLDHLADLVRQRPDSPTIGRYAYTWVRIWSRETTPAGRDGDDTVEEERLWWDEDLSGLRVSVRTERGVEVSEPHPYPAGGLPVVVRFPSADPTILVEQLDRQQPPQVGSVGRLRAVADLNLFHPLDRQQRVAVLRVLADTPGLSYRGTARDRSGRAGMAISADLVAGGLYRERVTLAFDPTTGELLSQETSRLADAGAPDPAEGTTSGYVLYLARSRTDRLG